MRLKRVEHSVAFWAFSFLLYGLCFGLIRVQAEALYHKSPRLTPRTRAEVPKPSPLLAPQLDLKRDNRVHHTPPPSVYSDLVPVSWQPEKKAPSDSPQARPAQPAPVRGQRSTQPQSHLHDGLPSWQSSVMTPAAQPARSAAPALHPNHPLHLSATPQNGLLFEEDAFALQAVAAPASRSSGEKPLVHFPQELADTRSAQSAMEAGFYPVGYRPYLPASIVVVSGKHQEALSHYNRASYYGHANQLREAILEYQQAIRKNPELADAYVGLSSTYLLKHQWEEVFLNARKALSLKTGFMDPGNIVQAKYNLSAAYCAADDYGQAKIFYNAVKLANHAQTAELWEYLKKNCKPKP
ncbi:tetratricopeptide repeat protein [Vampirovibrio chlorellavorus]|uniref:tetratricopeptide repeat protein n=1 Tax=Vampirovibrio chlorellavorus TaxID=758823 RepID=UPI0026EA02FC|nr:tetratricopeptide repeat protein [Vampirovibrio chlorellavorus]